MLSLAIIIIGAILAISLLILEVFFIPGITVVGIAGSILLVGEIAYGYITFGTPIGHYILAANLFCIGFGFYLFTRAKFLKHLSLETNIESKIETNAAQLHVGQTGATISRLNPIGKIEIEGEYYEAKSPDGFIDENQPIVITKVTGSQIEVTVQTA